VPADAEQSGKAIEQGAAELLRIWRLARAAAKRELGAGLLDDVMGPFLERAGKLLAEKGEPEKVWGGMTGVVRVSPPKGSQALTEEWAIVMEVLAAACEALESEPTVGEWLAKAVANAEASTTQMAGGTVGPEGVLTIYVFGGGAPSSGPAEPAPDAPPAGPSEGAPPNA
jgi:hypothetical protein